MISLIVPVGEGGEGKKGRRWRDRGSRYNPYVGRPYQYRGHYRNWNHGTYGRAYDARPYYQSPYRYWSLSRMFPSVPVGWSPGDRHQYSVSQPTQRQNGHSLAPLCPPLTR